MSGERRALDAARAVRRLLSTCDIGVLIIDTRFLQSFGHVGGMNRPTYPWRRKQK